MWNDGGGNSLDVSAFLKLSLDKQCDELKISLETLLLDYANDHWMVHGVKYARPESAALAQFRTTHWVGTDCEGTAVLMLMKAACLDYLASVNTFSCREDACIRYFEAQCIIHREKSKDIISEIERADETTVRSNLSEIIAQPRYSTIYPAMEVDTLIAIWKAMTSSWLAHYASLLLVDSSLRAGWPDLTLARGDALLFIEVKTSDKLHASQHKILTSILGPSGANVSVLRIKRHPPAQHLGTW